MRYGINTGTPKRAHVMGEHSAKREGADPKPHKHKRYVRELAQAAKALGIHPAELFKALQVERGKLKLAAKFNH